MVHFINNRRRLGAFGAALLAFALPACTSIDGVTAPGRDAVAAKPVAQTAVSARFDFVNAVGAGSAISSDGVSGEYRNAVCGVNAVVFFQNPTYLDGNLQLANPRAPDRKCVTFGAAAYPRKLTVQYPNDGFTQAYPGTINVNDMGTVESGPAQLRSMNMSIDGTGARCTRLAFGNLAGGSQVLVTRLSATSWGVASQPGGVAACVSASGVTTNIADLVFSFTVTLN